MDSEFRQQSREFVLSTRIFVEYSSPSGVMELSSGKNGSGILWFFREKGFEDRCVQAEVRSRAAGHTFNYAEGEGTPAAAGFWPSVYGTSPAWSGVTTEGQGVSRGRAFHGFKLKATAGYFEANVDPLICRQAGLSSSDTIGAKMLEMLMALPLATKRAALECTKLSPINPRVDKKLWAGQHWWVGPCPCQARACALEPNPSMTWGNCAVPGRAWTGLPSLVTRIS
ncbi:hypothetical protein Droror1_Dr00025736 [Drosera rotundifolia]